MHWALAIYIFILNLGLGLQNNLIPKTIREKILDLGHILYTGFGQVLLQEILNLNFGFGFFLFFFFFFLHLSVFWNLERLYILVISFEYVIVK